METLIKAVEFDEEKMVGATPYSEQWLIGTLREEDAEFLAASEGTNVEKVTAKNVSDGKGYVSEVNRVTIHFQDGRAPYEVILKVPTSATISEMYEGDVFNCEFVSRMHNRECDFYERCAPLLSACFPRPKVFKTVPCVPGRQVGCILMESVDDAQSVIPYSTLNEQQVRNVVIQMAKFHATFVLSDGSAWKDRFPDTVINSVVYYDTVIPYLEAMAADKPETYADTVALVVPLLKSKKFLDYTICDVYKDYGIPATLTHGDLWTNNVLYEVDAEGAISSRIAGIVDFQMAFEGSGVFDIARLLTTSTDGEVRRQIELDMLTLYFEEYGRRLREGGMEVPFDFEALRRVYQVHFAHQTIVLLHIPEMLRESVLPKCASPRERKVMEAQLDKVRLRAVHAMEDMMEFWDDLALENLL